MRFQVVERTPQPRALLASARAGESFQRECVDIGRVVVEAVDHQVIQFFDGDIGVQQRAHRVDLKYGCNPHQGNAAFESGETPPVRVGNGSPSMINMLDALNGWQLVAELGGVLDLPAAASFKHVSPAGVAVGVPLEEDLRRASEVGDRELTPLAAAYVRARGADPKCSFGDFVALSEPVDMATADYLRGVVSDGVVAPGFEPGTFETLVAKKGGSFVVLEIDPGYRPPPIESRDVFIPFRDNVDHAAKHGVRYIVQPGGSARDGEVEAACREYGIAMVHTGVRLFHH